MSLNKKPPSTKPIVFRTKDGRLHNGFYLKDANRYVRGVNRWKDTDLDVWFNDDDVTVWGEEEEQIEGQTSLFGDDLDDAVIEAVDNELHKW